MVCVCAEADAITECSRADNILHINRLRKTQSEEEEKKGDQHHKQTKEREKNLS